MWAIECVFECKDLSAANAKRATWNGKPGFLGGFTHYPDKNNAFAVAVGYWAVTGTPPNSSLLPWGCKLVNLDQPSLNFVLGII